MGGEQGSLLPEEIDINMHDEEATVGIAREKLSSDGIKLSRIDMIQYCLILISHRN